MPSRIKSILFGKSSSPSLQAAKPYDSHVALDPPVKGSYPIAGNGPSVLDEIQRSRAKRQSATESIRTVTAPAPNIPRRREDTAQRPRTAPHDGTAGGGHTRTKSSKSTKDGRTLSGFSTKAPPSSVSRRSSIRSTTDNDRAPPLPHISSPAAPSVSTVVSSPLTREVRTYVPRTGNANTNPLPPFAPPFAQQHGRSDSRASHASHKSHVDLLEAHSSIIRTREATINRTKASGVRDYGEDVADRNIESFGDRLYRDSKLDINLPEFSYLKSVYAPKRIAKLAEPYSRVGSALGHVLGVDGSNGDDTHFSKGQTQPRADSTRSAISARTGPRPTSIYPPRTDSISATASNGRSRDDQRSILSPLSSSTAETSSEESLALENKRYPSVNPPEAASTPPIPERGRARPSTAVNVISMTTPTRKSNPSPVPPPGKITSLPHSRQTSSTRPTQHSSSNTKQRSMSASSQNTIVPRNGVKSLRKGSVTYSAFPDHNQTSSRPSTANGNKQQGMKIEGANQPPPVDRGGYFKDSVDTDVTTKNLPAIVHERVTPEIRQELITGEINSHNASHHSLPIIETQILPTKDNTKRQDGKYLVEIPESIVPNKKVTDKSDQNWNISKSGPSVLTNVINDFETASRASTDSAPDGPVVGLARREPGSRPRGNSKASSVKSPSKHEPTEPKVRSRANSRAASIKSIKSLIKRETVLTSKKEPTTKESIPRTDYTWRRTPPFETMAGQTQPLYADASIVNLSESMYYSSEDDEPGATFGAAKPTAQGEEGLLFRDSGYGSGGMLPGLVAKSPAAKINRVMQPRHADSMFGRPKVTSNAEGEATELSKRMRERSKSSVTSKTYVNYGFDKGTRKMSLK